MVYKEVNNICVQLSKGDIIKKWFLNVCKKGDEENLNKHFIKAKFETKAEGLKAFNQILEQLKNEEKFKLPCGHNNAGKINLYPFDEWVCFECGLKTKIILKDIPKEIKPNYEKGFNILMDYWDSLPDEEKPEIDKRLKKIGI